MFKRGWEHGQARIVGRQSSDHGTLLHPSTDRWHWSYDYVADVEPDSGEPVFRAKFTAQFSDGPKYLRHPDVGGLARVRFDPTSGQVEFDWATLRADAKASRETKKQDFDALAAERPATHTSGDHRGEQPDPQLRGARVALRQARRSGDTAEVKRLTAELDRLEHGDTHPRSTRVLSRSSND